MHAPHGVDLINNLLEQLGNVQRKLGRTTDPNKRRRLEDQKRGINSKLDRLSGKAT